MKRTTSIALGAVTGTSLLVGTVAMVRRRKKATKPAGAASGGGFVPPPPDAVWLKNLAPSDEPGAGPSVPPAVEPPGTASPAVYVLASADGSPVELDAGKFLDARFSPLPLAQHPTRTQMGRIYQSFAAMGVDDQTGKLNRRPSPESVDAALDLATDLDLEKAPAPVGTAVRDFAKLAWQLPSLEKKA